ncbi:MAG: NusG domain II-containing protein, partial [Thiomargarita sp.]|nr:NusG domain II-containing protein [Thiomargarita sp.]
MTLADRIIVILAVSLVVWLYIHYWGGGRTADYALILVAQKAPKQVNLQIPQLISIQGRLGESVIEVSEEGIRFITAPCRNQYCIHAGWLTKGGDFMACIPNQVSIALHRTVEFDGIA